MDDPIAKPQAPHRKSRWRWWKPIAGLALIVVGVIYGIPRALNSDAARRWLHERANRALDGGLLNVDRFRFSWLGPTLLEGVTLRDTRGELIVAARGIAWDRNLLQIPVLGANLGTVTLFGAALDVQRSADGSVDLAELLRPILQGKPETDLTVKVVGGSLRLRSPELAEPIRASRIDLAVRRPPAPGKVSWTANLGDAGGHSLAIDGDFDRWGDGPSDRRDLRLELAPKGWPLALRAGDLTVRGDFDRTIVAERRGGLWGVEADLEIAQFEATGPPLKGDRLHADAIVAKASAAQGDSGWTIRSLDVSTPVGSARTTGPFPPPAGSASRLEGRVDLAAGVAMLPHLLPLREGLALDRGTAEWSIAAEGAPGARSWTAEAKVAEFAAHRDETAFSLREPATLSLLANERDGALAVDRLAIRSAFLDAEGRGDLDRGIAVTGRIDLAALQRQAADFLDLGSTEIAGAGPIAGDFRRTGDRFVAHLSANLDDASVGPSGDPVRLEGVGLSAATEGALALDPAAWTTDATFALKSARRAGLDLGPTTVAARIAPGSVTLEPIATTLNGGTLAVVPELQLGDTPTFRLKAGTSLEDAEVNEEATRRVLAFVAPVLDKATRVSGRVSATIDRAEFPIGPDAGKKAVVEGNVVFNDLVFAPGPVTADLLAMLNRSDSSLRLDQPVVLSIADGRIRQTGLALPVGDVTEIAVEGSVGFDKTMDLVATMPITQAMFPNRALIGDFVRGARIKVPIGGTLEHPKVDKEAFQAALKELGKDVLIRSATQGAASLLFRLARPRDPNAPPPLTPEERKAQRQERKMQRRGGP